MVINNRIPPVVGPVRRDWRLKLIEKTRGNQTHEGRIVLAAIGKEPSNPPYFRGRANITSDGMVLCDFVSADGVYHHDDVVGTDSDLVRNMVALASFSGLNDDEKIEFLALVNDWIAVDNRSTTRIKRVMLVE